MSDLVLSFRFGSGEKAHEHGGRGGPVLSMSLKSKPVFPSCSGLVWFVERGSDEMDRGRGGRERTVLSTLLESGPILSFRFGSIWSIRFVVKRSGIKGCERGGHGGRCGPVLSTLSKSGPIFSSPFGSVRFVERSSCGKARELEDGRERPMLSAF